MLSVETIIVAGAIVSVLFTAWKFFSDWRRDNLLRTKEAADVVSSQKQAEAAAVTVIEATANLVDKVLSAKIDSLRDWSAIQFKTIAVSHEQMNKNIVDLTRRTIGLERHIADKTITPKLFNGSEGSNG